jgi:uncharacterized membrane protein
VEAALVEAEEPRSSSANRRLVAQRQALFSGSLFFSGFQFLRKREEEKKREMGEGDEMCGLRVKNERKK